jgi:Protein of unknown function (DUF4435)
MSDLVANIGDILQGNNQIFNRNTVQVYVENEEDVPFWKYFFTKYDIETSVSPASKGHLQGGKSAVMSLENNVNKFFLLCVDSDNDYMMQRQTTLSRRVIDNPYIFETYLHSMESYRCYSKYLHDIVVDAVLVDKKIFDFELFLEEYSKIIYELFIKFIYFEKKHQLNAEAYRIEYEPQKTVVTEDELQVWQNDNKISAHIFSQNKNFCPAIKVSSPIKIADNGQSALDDLKIRVDAAYGNLPTVSPQDLDKIKTDLATLGITPQNTYLFIQGHTLYDNVVKPILNTVADNLKSKKLVEFATNAKHDTQAKEKLNEYKKIVFKAKKDELTAVERSWFNAKYYAQCPFTTKIEDDIKRYKSII